MSKEGLQKAAQVFIDMQQLRIEFLGHSKDKQDILLGQMLEVGKDAMQKHFAEITLMEKYDSI